MVLPYVFRLGISGWYSSGARLSVLLTPFQWRMIKPMMLAASWASAKAGASWPCAASQIHRNIELGIVSLGAEARAAMKPSIIERFIAFSGTESPIKKSSSKAISASVKGSASEVLGFMICDAPKSPLTQLFMGKIAQSSQPRMSQALEHFWLHNAC